MIRLVGVGVGVGWGVGSGVGGGVGRRPWVPGSGCGAGAAVWAAALARTVGRGARVREPAVRVSVSPDGGVAEGGCRSLRPVAEVAPGAAALPARGRTSRPAPEPSGVAGPAAGGTTAAAWRRPRPGVPGRADPAGCRVADPPDRSA